MPISNPSPAFTLNGSSGSLSISAGANIGIGQANNTITISGSIQTVTQSLTGLGNTTLGSTGTFSNLLQFSGAGVASVGISGNTVTISVPSGGGAAGTNTISASGTSITGTALSLAIAAGNNISLATATAAGSMTISISGENALSASGFASSTGTMVLSAGPGIALSTGASTITISNSAAYSTVSLTGLGNTTVSSSGTFNNVLDFSGAGIISVGISNNSITLSATTPSVTNYSTISLTALGNTTLSSSGTLGNVLNISGAGGVSVGISNNSITISGATAGGATSKLSFTQNGILQQAGLLTSTSGTLTGSLAFGSSLFLQRLFIPVAMTLTEADLVMGLSFNATSNGAGTLSRSLAIYSFGNSTSLASVASVSGTSAWTTGTSTVAGSVSITEFQGGWTGPNVVPMTFAGTSLSAGEYVIGNLFNFAQGSSTWSLSVYGANAAYFSSTTLSFLNSISSTTASAWNGSGSFTASMNTGTNSSTSSRVAIKVTAFSSGATETVLSSIAQGSATSTISFLSSSTLPTFGFVGTGSSTSAFPFWFSAGVMSTGAIPVAITLTSSAVTYLGSTALIQPWFALVGS